MKIEISEDDYDRILGCVAQYRGQIFGWYSREIDESIKTLIQKEMAEHDEFMRRLVSARETNVSSVD